MSSIFFPPLPSPVPHQHDNFKYLRFYFTLPSLNPTNNPFHFSSSSSPNSPHHHQHLPLPTLAPPPPSHPLSNRYHSTSPTHPPTHPPQFILTLGKTRYGPHSSGSTHFHPGAKIPVGDVCRFYCPSRTLH